MNGHKTQIQPDRFRVICLECPWFVYEPGADEAKLREIGFRHNHASRER